MALPTTAAGLSSEIVQELNSDVETIWSTTYLNTPVSSDPFVRVRPVGANTISLAALTQMPLMSKWLGGKQLNTVNTQAVTLRSADYESTVGIERSDFMSDRIGLYADLAFHLGFVGKKHQDYEARKVLQAGYPPTLAAGVAGAAAFKYLAGEAGTKSALTGDDLFSSTHTLDPNAPGGISQGPGLGLTTAGNQSNLVSGSFLNAPLVQTGYENMIQFSGDRSQPFNWEPSILVVPPQQLTNARMAVESYTNPLVSANSSLASTAGSVAANQTLQNMVASYGLKVQLVRELSNDPNVAYLCGEIQGIKALTYGQFIAPHLIPLVTPESFAVFYHKRFEWSVEDNVLMYCAVWSSIIRISVLGS